MKTYQVTGPVLSVTDDAIVVQKGKDKWQIARDATTKVTGDLKVGAKVTVEYRMTGTAIDVKGATAHGWQVGFHGTAKTSVLGQAVSHGCVRMANPDIVEVYKRVKIGTEVVVE